jgi:hypothetical protein
MKKILLLFICLLVSCIIYPKPKINYASLTEKVELNPVYMISARYEAGLRNQPVMIYLKDKVFIEAKDIEDGKVVYSVITNFARPEIGGYAAFFEDIISDYDLSKAKIRYLDGRTIDNTGEIIQVSKSTSTKLLLVPDWTEDKVIAFDFNTGDLVDPNYIPSNSPNLQSPKQALQRSKTRIFVSDQISDAVQEYDTSGTYIRWFAPAGGVNNAILDNVRGIKFRPNGNLLVCNASGTAQNTIQQFDTGGVYINSFMTASVNSPFTVLYRESDILLGNSSGTPKMFKYDFSGNLIGAFTSTTLNFVQQLIKNSNGNIIACEFSGTGSGLKVFDSTGNLLTTLSGVTGVRGVFRLTNGNYLTTNGAGIYEIDDTSGAMIRQILASSNLQYINVFDPDYPTSIENEFEIPDNFELNQNYPNPFNPTTNVQFSIANVQFVTLKVFNSIGQEVSTLVNEELQPGKYEIQFDGSSLSSGVYYYKLSTDKFSDTKKMILLK